MPTMRQRRRGDELVYCSGGQIEADNGFDPIGSPGVCKPVDRGPLTDGHAGSRTGLRSRVTRSYYLWRQVLPRLGSLWH